MLKSTPTMKNLLFQLNKVIMGVVLTLSLVSSLAFTVPAQAQSRNSNIPDTCRGNCPLIGNRTISGDERSIANFIIGIAQALTYIVGALAVLFLVYGGFLFVTDSGDGKRAENGKKILTNAVIGLILAIVAGSIVAVVGGLVSGDALRGFLN